MNGYLSIVLFAFLAALFGIIPLVISRLITPRNLSSDKTLAYECGFDAFSDARFQFDIRFYLVAILFIIFDLEIAFLFPWSVIFKTAMTTQALWAMVAFLLLLLFGFIYEWRKGALEWE